MLQASLRFLAGSDGAVVMPDGQLDNSGSSIASGERALNYLGAKRLAECLHGLKCRRVVEERAEQLHIKVREKRAPLRELVMLLPQNMNLNP